MRKLIWHLAVSAAVIGVLLSVCRQLPHVDHATVALLMVLVIVALSRTWGRREALTATIVGAAGFVYFFLPPMGLRNANREHWVALMAFLVTAVVTGDIATKLNNRRIEAVRLHSDMDQLYQLVNALLESGNAEATARQVADKLLEIFGAEGVALYDQHTGEIVRSGPRGDAISDTALHNAAEFGVTSHDAHRLFSLIPIRHGDESWGSLGMFGAKISEPLMKAIAARVGLGLARLYAMEISTAAEVARRSGELRSAVMDAMAHEIRNPLNSIRIAATTLLAKNAGGGPQSADPDQQEMLAIIDEEVRRMDRYLDEAVRLARLEAGEVSVKKEPQNIAELIPAAIADVSALAGNRPIEVLAPKTLPPAECDKDLIARVLRQLLSNAFQYSPHDSPLTVSAEYDGSAVVIDVVDQGPGVDENERERIFEKYYRGSAGRTGVRGNGLGLASAKSIVQAHGGRIWVTEPPSGGAAFHVSLPVNAGNGAGA